MGANAGVENLPRAVAAHRRWAPMAGAVMLAVAVIAVFVLLMAGQSPPRKQAVPAQTLDLKRHYHTPASQFVNRQFPWGEVPRGKRTFANVPLDIGGAIYLWGALNARRGMEFAEQVEGIEVGRKFETLYLFHGAFMSAAEGAPVYRLTMHYADGTSSEHAIRFGDHVRDWYEGPTSKTKLNDPKSRFVWRTDHPRTNPERPIKLRFSITPIENPKPTLEVKSINLASGKGDANGCILAMTTGPANLLEAAAEGRDSDGQ
jgi:hypothetical protein